MSAFKIRDFRQLTQARFLYTLGYQTQSVVMGWRIYQIMKAPIYLGYIGLAEAFPAISIAFFSGYIVDRSNPLKIYKNILFLQMVSVMILLAEAYNYLGGDPHQRLVWIYLAGFVTGVGRGFSSPALNALVPQVVPRNILVQSSTWITSAFQISTVVGPALGGFMYAWGGPRAPYWFVTVSLVLSMVSLLMIRLVPQIHPSGAEPMMQRLTSGIRFVFASQFLLSAASLDMFAVFFGGATALLPIFASEILKTGPSGLGILRASPSFGALIVSAYLIRRPPGAGAGKILLGVVAGFGLCMIGFALSTQFWVACAFLAVSGALDSVSMVVRGAIVQLASPDHMRGRVAAVNSIFIGSSNEIGAFESGVAAKFLGTVPSVVFGGCMTLLTVLITAWRATKLRELELSKL